MGINISAEKINMTFLLKGFGEIFIKLVAYLELLRTRSSFTLLIPHVPL
jgi:hypothetical protein